MNNRLEEFLKLPENYQKLAQCSQLFMKPNIPSKKLTNALQSYVHLALIRAGQTTSFQPEQIVLLFDDTVFGSAKDGFVLTENFIIVKAAFEDPSLTFLKDIKMISWESTLFSTNLYFNGNKIIELSQINKKDMMMLCTTLQRYLDMSKSQDQPQQSFHQSNASQRNHQSDSASTYDFSKVTEQDQHIIELDLSFIVLDILSSFTFCEPTKWNDQHIDLLMRSLSDDVLQSPYQQKRILNYIEHLQHANINDAIQRLLKYAPKIELRLMLVMRAAQLVNLAYPYQFTKIYNTISPLAKKLDVSDQDIEYMFDTIKKNAQQKKYQNSHNQSSLDEITRAKEILEITAPALS